MKINLKYLNLLLLIGVSSALKAQIRTNRSFQHVEIKKDAKKWYAHPDSTNFNFSISSDHFLLGTLNGYMGRKYFNPEDNTIDTYKGASHLKSFIYEFIENNYNSIPDSSDTDYLKDDKVAKIINSYFDQEGKINIQELKNENEIYSYLLGKYLKYGEHLDADIYKIQIVNSFEGDLIYKSLKQLGCDKILYKSYRGYIPSSQFFYFEATPRMVKYFKSVTSLKEKIQEDYIVSLIEHTSRNNIDDIKSSMEELKSREVNKINDVFNKVIN